MPYVLDNNRHAIVAEGEVTFTGVAGPEIPLVARIFIDIGIAFATIAATVLTAGTALPAIVPSIAGSAVGLATNTSIDIEEGHTDALTLGLDIGLPVLTEGLGSLAAVGIREATIPARLGAYLSERVGIDPLAVEGRLTIKNILNQGKEQAELLGKVNITGFVATPEDVAKYGATAGRASEEVTRANNELLQKSIKQLEENILEVEQTFRSVGDFFDKLTGSVREFLGGLLPRLSVIIKQMKEYLRAIKKVLTEALNPVNFAKTHIESQVKAILKNIKPEELEMKAKLKTIYQRYQVRKQSIMQNALISKYNINKVMSTWVLGTSLVINDAEDDGTINNAHLIWWFIPEQTHHNGERGAVPEPMGKRPVAMLNINQAQYDYIMEEASKGRFYLDNVAGGKAPTSLFGSGGVRISDLKDNFINKLFKNALHIVPGYDLFVDVKMSIGQFQTLTDKIVSGQYGTDVVKGLTNYKKYLHEYGTKFLPSQYKSEMIGVYNNGKFDGSTNLLKSLDSRAQAKMSNVNKSGVIQKVKSY